ncbi:Dolichol kinase [Sergentomyia squamirostris]
MTTTDDIVDVTEENPENRMPGDLEVVGFFSQKHLDFNCKSMGIVRRPNVGNGFWLSILVPLAMITNAWTHSRSSRLLYHVCSLVTLGLFLQFLDVFLKLNSRKVHFLINVVTKVIPGVISSLLLWFLIAFDLKLSFLIGIICCIFFNFCFIFLLKRLPRSFSLGEASLVAQGITIFIFGATVMIVTALLQRPESKIDELTVILCIALLGIVLVAFVTYAIPFCRRAVIFSFLILVWISSVFATPVTDPLPIILVFDFIFHDVGRVSVLLIYAGIVGLTGAFVAWHISRNTSSTSVSMRKVFHLVVVIVFLIGLILQCTMLFFASGIVLALFITFEAMRLINFPVVSPHLASIVRAFVDEKDSGVVAFTPIYLLVGCALPLWLHPSPCDLTDSTTFTLLPLLAGVLSVGIGDTMAGVVGSKLGRHRLPHSEKTIEGLLANITSQLATILLFYTLGFLVLNLQTALVSCIGVITSAVLEAKSDQIDNLFLPLVTFIIFSLNF